MERDHREIKRDWKDQKSQNISTFLIKVDFFDLLIDLFDLLIDFIDLLIDI